MTDEVIRMRPPVLRRATEAGCAGWKPIARPQTEITAEPMPAPVLRTDELAAPDSVDEGNPRPVTDSVHR